MNRYTLLALLLQGVAVLGAITDCGAGKSLFQVNALGFWPDPPVTGQDTSISFLYTVPPGVNITSGTANYDVSLNGISFPTTTDDLCVDSKNCPLVPGTYNLTSTDVWDGGVSGKIVSKISWYDAAKTLLLCAQMTFRV